MVSARKALGSNTRPRANPGEVAVGHASQIREGQSHGFLPKDGHDQIFIVRTGGNYFAYRNLCPHNGLRMEYHRHRFLSADRSEIICFAHGAHFRIQDGFCVSGICEGERLLKLPCRVENGWLVVKVDLNDNVKKI